MKRILLFIIPLLIAAGCSGNEEKSITGEWYGESKTGFKQTFQFNENNTVVWKLESDSFSGSFYLNYKFDNSVSPYKIDISGFEDSPLKDKTLYCIIEFVNDSTFRMDCEPGKPGGSGEGIRPTEFTDDTETYIRVK